MYRNIITGFLLLFSVYGVAAPVKVSGRILTEEGKPLAYAAVAVNNRLIGTSAGEDGSYVLTLPAAGEYKLVATFVGYKQQEKTVEVEEALTLDFVLPEDMIHMETVVVTGTRTPKLLKNAPVVTRVITAEEIRKSDVTDIRGLLEMELPGVEFSYSMNQQVSVNMQGFGGMGVLFLVDGERLAGETLDNVDYSRLNLDNVERVEIVKGAASSLYGSNAVGGVVNIITKKVTEPWSAHVYTRWGKHNEQRHGGSLGLKARKVSSMTNFQYTGIDSYELGEGDYSTLYGNSSWHLKEQLGYRVSERLNLTARGGYFFRERDYQPEQKDRYRDFSGGWRMDYAMGENHQLEAGYHFDQYDKSNYYVLKEKDIREYSNRQHSGRILYHYSSGTGNTLTAGGDYLNDYLMSYQFVDNGSYSRSTADWFVQYDWNLTARLNLIMGIRWDYDSQLDKMYGSPKLSLMYKMGNCSLRGSFAGGFRAPTLKEMYMNFNMANIFMIYGNPDLEAETSHNFTLSAEVVKRRFSFTLTGYYNLVENRINTVWNSGLNGMQYVNTEDVNVLAADADFALRLPCGFGARLSYVYTREFLEDGVVKTSDTRPHSATVRLEYGKMFRNYSFHLALSGRVMSEVSTHTLATTGGNTYEKVSYPAYTTWKLVASQQIRKPFTLTVTVDNLFNYHPSYRYYNSPMTDGVSLAAGLSVNLEQIWKK